MLGESPGAGLSINPFIRYQYDATVKVMIFSFMHAFVVVSSLAHACISSWEAGMAYLYGGLVTWHLLLFLFGSWAFFFPQLIGSAWLPRLLKDI